MKKFTINCDFGGQLAPFTIYIGQPEQGHHPLHFQADWLAKQRGGTIPAEVMSAIDKLKELAVRNNVLLEDLCVYALGEAQEVTTPETSQQPQEAISEDISTETSSDIHEETIENDAPEDDSTENNTST